MTVAAVVKPGRAVALDRVRGAAILCMVADHLALVAGDMSWVRLTVGRLAMPLFFLLAGHLAGRLSWRLALIAGVGLVLPLAVPWIDSPNVLVALALGCVILWACRRLGLHPFVVAVTSMAAAANGWGLFGRGSYDFFALWGLMAAGASIPRSVFERLGGPLPGWLASPGRRPLSIYVGHLVLLAGASAAVAGSGGA